MDFPKAHLFICVNDRGPNAKRECCAAKGAQELRDHIKAACKARGLPKGSFRINNAGCLDKCERGIAAVLYPKGEWFLDLKLGDVEKLITAVEKAAREES
jgi:predicted metal-binding protein